MDLGSFPPPLHRITPAEKSSTTHRQGERKCQFPSRGTLDRCLGKLISTT